MKIGLNFFFRHSCFLETKRQTQQAIITHFNHFKVYVRSVRCWFFKTFKPTSRMISKFQRNTSKFLELRRCLMFKRLLLFAVDLKEPETPKVEWWFWILNFDDFSCSPRIFGSQYYFVIAMQHPKTSQVAAWRNFYFHILWDFWVASRMNERSPQISSHRQPNRQTSRQILNAKGSSGLFDFKHFTVLVRKY